MNKQPNIFKRWWRLAEPNKKYFAGQITFYIIYTVFLSVITIFAARTINCMYQKDWTGAFINLGIELLTIVIRNIAIHFQYICYGKQVRHVRNMGAKKIYKKIMSCKSDDFKQISKDKVINIALNNMAHMGDFADNISAFIADCFQVGFTLVAVFMSNKLAALIVAALGVVNFFAYFLFNKKLGKIMLERFEKKDDMFKSYSKIIDGKNVIREFEKKDDYESLILNDSDNFGKAYEKYYNVYSYKNNLYFVLWNVVVYAITAMLLYMVSKGNLDIAVYLIIVPYLSTCTSKLNSLFDKTNNLENMRVDVDRVNLILNMSDEELVQYGELNQNVEGYSLGLVDVTYNKRAGENFEIKDANMTFTTNAINVVKSAKGGGKRAIFNMLRRSAQPNKGKILLDNLDLYDYNPKTFKNHIDYCASHPTFINGSIKENLLLANKDFNKVVEVCKNLDVFDTIEELQNGFDTNIYEIKNTSFLFLLGLVRALLSNCKILMIYEIPQDAPENFRKHLIDFLKKFKIDKTILLFTHTNKYDELATTVYAVKNGEVIKEK